MKAIILCAGVGVRFRPLSLIQPKPLTPLRGLPLLEHTLRLLHAHGVRDIALITGYMQECFTYLVDKYDVTLRYNGHFATHNNAMSVACATDMLDDTLIIDGDLWFTADFFPCVRPHVSQFISQPTTHGLEWELKTDATGRIVEVEKWTPTGYGMVGVSYWTGEAARVLVEELSRCTPEEYWEDAALRVIARTPVYMSPMPQGFVQEMDTIKDAMDFDLLTHENIAHICSVNFNSVKLKGLTNNTWLIRDIDGVLLTLRVPGKGTERFIHRDHEPVIIAQIADKHITPPTTFYPEGFKTTVFLEQHRITTFRDMHPAFYARLAAALHLLHAVPHTPASPLAPLYMAKDIVMYEEQSGFCAEASARRVLLEYARAFDAEPQVLCHRDLLLENILLIAADSAGQNTPEILDLQLIDFEYAGFTHPLWDAASFILEANLSEQQRQDFMQACGITGEASENALARMEIVVDYVWGLWGLVNGYTEYGENRLHRAFSRLAVHDA